jgi:hypothetical protein
LPATWWLRDGYFVGVETFATSIHHYKTFAVTLYPFVCSIGVGRSSSTNTLPSPGCRQRICTP